MESTDGSICYHNHIILTVFYCYYHYPYADPYLQNRISWGLVFLLEFISEAIVTHWDVLLLQLRIHDK